MGDFKDGLDRASRRESNNHKEGRTGSGTPMKRFSKGNRGGNPTSGGGINRATKK